MNVRSSKVAQVRGRSEPNPRMRYRRQLGLDLDVFDHGRGERARRLAGEGSPPIACGRARPRMRRFIGRLAIFSGRPIKYA